MNELELLENPEADYYDFENPEDYDYDYENPEPMFELVSANPNSKGAKAMRKAARLRKQGYGKSEALTEAWKQVGSKSNPEFEPSPLLVVMVVAGIGLGIYRWKKGYWPWEGAGIARQKASAVARAQQIMRANAKKEQESYGSVQVIKPATSYAEEQVSLIFP